MSHYAAIEGGGTKFVCALADEDGVLIRTTRLATRGPRETLDDVCAFFAGEALRAVGIAMFGPLELRAKAHDDYGSLLDTPKPGWSRFPIRAELERRLGAPVAIDTDVNAAALAEAREGAGVGGDPVVYFTIGTGIGVGAIVHGEPLHGLMHPELGHLPMPTLLDPRGVPDIFPGICVFHHRCLEGLASGTAIAARAGHVAESLPTSHPALALAADYVAHGVVAAVLALSPERIVIGGGVSKVPGFRDRAREATVRLLGGYVPRPELAPEARGYIVEPALTDLVGIRGALLLARDAA